MTDETKARRYREQFLVRVAGAFVQVSVDVFDPGQSRATIFCLHDFTGAGSDFTRLGNLLISQSFRVIAPDMVGRGASAFLSDPEKYKAETYVAILVAIMEHFPDKRIMIVGKGWGGVVALLAIRRAKFELERLVLADVPLNWSAGVDPLLEAVAANPHFDTIEQAQSLLLDSDEFRGLPRAVGLELIAGRIRRTATGHAMHFDPALLLSNQKLAKRQYSTLKLLHATRARLLYMTSEVLNDADRIGIDALIAERANRVHAEALAQGSRIHFTTAHQLLLTLGFIRSPLLPAD